MQGVNDSRRQSSEAAAALPEARVSRRRRAPSVVWLVPLLAAVVAGYLVFERIQEFGPKITIRFQDGSGIRTGQTPIKYRGVPIGEVTAVALSPDQRYVLVHARLDRSAAPIAREGSAFWIVRPEVEFGAITGLNTVISGPEIQVLPGSGAAKSEFVGMDRAPVAYEGKGRRIVLRAARPESLRRNSPVYYRGVEVGVVHDVALGNDAAVTEIHVLVRERYANLVRADSVFWNVSGARVSAGLFKGVDIRVESLRALLAGGIAFATPQGSSAPAKDGAVFPLHANPRTEWLHWTPRIALPAKDDPAKPAGTGSGLALTPPGKT